MSRIEEALKRAQGPQIGNVETPSVSAWHFDRLPQENADEPAIPPVRKVALPTAPESPSREEDEAATRGLTAEDGGRHWRHRFSDALAEKLVIMDKTSSLTVEQFRRIAASLHQLQIERNVRVVLVASALPGEGKTLTATNLALTLSESYQRRVLLIDGDLRCPQLHEVFQLPNGSGLHEGLTAAKDQPLSVAQISPRLAVLPAGRPDPDPMRILSSDRMKHVVAEAATAFDWVILDSPPVVPLSDSHLLARMADVALLVVGAGRTPYKLIARAVEILGRDRVAGVILNNVEDSVVAANAGGYGEYHSAIPKGQ